MRTLADFWWDIFSIIMELSGYVILLVQTIDDEMKLYGEFFIRNSHSIALNSYCNIGM